MFEEELNVYLVPHTILTLVGLFGIHDLYTYKGIAKYVERVSLTNAVVCGRESRRLLRVSFKCLF